MTPLQGKITPEVIATMRKLGDPMLNKQADEWEALLKKSSPQYLDKLITQDSTMLQIKEHVVKLMEVDDPVMILGETGTGKELIANALHNGREGNMIAINCAGMPESLIESELFGHVKGAFTGADKDKKGLLDEASDGTIFLDEIGEMPLLMQAKLLRAIQERKIRKVGGTLDIHINCRFVCATHVDLELCKTFRRDLYWRLSTFILRPTPLRLRTCDIIPILDSLQEKDNPLPIEFKEEIYKRTIQGSEMLSGNVRELQQMVRRFYVLGPNGTQV